MAKRDQEWIIFRVVNTSSVLVIIVQDKTSDRLQDKPVMLFEDDVISHLFGQIEHCQQVNSLDRDRDHLPFLISSDSSSLG